MNEPADIVLRMPSGLEFSIYFTGDGVVVKGEQESMAKILKRSTEEARTQVGPADGDPNHAVASILADRFGIEVVSVAETPSVPLLYPGEEIVY